MNTSRKIGWSGAVSVGVLALLAVWNSVGAGLSLAQEQYFADTVLEAYVKASNSQLGDRFGSSVALSGDALAVGAAEERSCANGVNGDQTNNSCPGGGEEVPSRHRCR
jgi:hypothetical protein